MSSLGTRNPSEKANRYNSDCNRADGENEKSRYYSSDDPAIGFARFLGSTKVDVEELDVPHVGAPANIEHVAEYRHCTDSSVDPNVDQHADKRGRRCAEPRRCEHDVPGERRAGNVTNYRNESEDRISSDAYSRARDLDR